MAPQRSVSQSLTFRPCHSSTPNAPSVLEMLLSVSQQNRGARSVSVSPCSAWPISSKVIGAVKYTKLGIFLEEEVCDEAADSRAKIWGNTIKVRHFSCTSCSRNINYLVLLREHLMWENGEVCSRFAHAVFLSPSRSPSRHRRRRFMIRAVRGQTDTRR